MLLALLRLLAIQSGKIEVDGINLTRIPRNIVRDRCFVAVTQDPLILPEESLRFNLDPVSSRADELLVEALTKVGLWSAFIRRIDEEGETTTSLLHKDEVTSSVDTHTESLIPDIIDKEFTLRGHTVILVAHRTTVLASHTKPGRDLVVRMRDGCIDRVITDLSTLGQPNCGNQG